MNKILTFDCYGTLIDTLPFYNEIGKIGEELGLDSKKIVETFVNYEDRLMYGESFRKLSDIIYKALEYCEFELKCDKIKREFERLIEMHRNLLPFEEVKSTLTSLKSKGFALAILSNSEWSIMNYNLKSLETKIDYVFLAEDLKYYKPQIDFFKRVEQEILINRDFHVHIAAGFWWDIVPATNLRWNKIWVNRKGKSGLKEYEPYTEISKLDEIFDKLKNGKFGLFA
jgi:2-haloacid dehalogenase